ncbi:MAG: hypothetical protein COS95_03750 [Ignavibacteriales bacterium CG07_land_8_20_14_0_80_59_12]|nr:MAG: hypothetical protein COS95_03750 [Ignavibacteriales bacterium CG07_land_8_20_14_0_80_59_12]
MKRPNMIFGIVLVAVMTLLAGCSTLDNPVGVPANPAVGTGSVSPTPTLIFLPRSGGGPLSKDITVSKFITALSGGLLKVHGEYLDEGRAVTVRTDMSLRIAPQSISESGWFSIALDDEMLAADFGPGGTAFRTPALLDMTTTGLDLSAVPEGANVHLYWYDPATASWEPMSANITVSRSRGKIVCEDGEIPHFSRYGFGF